MNGRRLVPLVLAGAALVAGGHAHAADGRPPATAKPGAKPVARLKMLEIVTVPPVSGMGFTLDGRRFTSRGNGIARIEYDASRPLRGRLSADDSETRPGVIATLSRWYGDLDEPSQEHLKAALNLHFSVAFGFADLQGNRVGPRRVASLRVKSSHGVVSLLDSVNLTKPVWLQGSRVVSTPTGPARKDIVYSIERVLVNGANVVNRAQQRFWPHRQPKVEISLLFYTARFSARDALLRFPLGPGVRLRHPDGKVEYYPFGDSAELTVDGLPRGEYWVEVEGPGFSFTRPVSLSRNQDVRLEVVSYLDLGLALLLLLTSALGLLVIGRPQLARPALGWAKRLTGGLHEPGRGTR